MAESHALSVNSAVSGLSEIQPPPERLIFGDARCALPKITPICPDSVAAFGKNTHPSTAVLFGTIHNESNQPIVNPKENYAALAQRLHDLNAKNNHIPALTAEQVEALPKQVQEMIGKQIGGVYLNCLGKQGAGGESSALTSVVFLRALTETGGIQQAELAVKQLMGVLGDELVGFSAAVIETDGTARIINEGKGITRVIQTDGTVKEIQSGEKMVKGEKIVLCADEEQDRLSQLGKATPEQIVNTLTQRFNNRSVDATAAAELSVEPPISPPSEEARPPVNKSKLDLEVRHLVDLPSQKIKLADFIRQNQTDIDAVQGKDGLLERVKKLLPPDRQESQADYEIKVLQAIERIIRNPDLIKPEDKAIASAVVRGVDVSRTPFVCMAVEAVAAQRMAQSNQERQQQYQQFLDQEKRRDVKTAVVHTEATASVEGDLNHIFTADKEWKLLPQRDLYAFTLVADQLLDAKIDEQGSYRERMRRLEMVLHDANANAAEKTTASRQLVDVRKDFYINCIEAIKTVNKPADINPVSDRPHDKVIIQMQERLRQIAKDPDAVKTMIGNYQGVGIKDKDALLSDRHQDKIQEILDDKERPYLFDYAIKGADLMRRRISYSLDGQLYEVPEEINYKQFEQRDKTIEEIAQTSIAAGTSAGSPTIVSAQTPASQTQTVSSAYSVIQPSGKTAGPSSGYPVISQSSAAMPGISQPAVSRPASGTSQPTISYPPVTPGISRPTISSSNAGISRPTISQPSIYPGISRPTLSTPYRPYGPTPGPSRPGPLPNEVNFGLAAAKQRLEHTDQSGTRVADLEVLEERDREAARLLMNEDRKKWEAKAPLIKKFFSRFWKYNVGLTATYAKEKGHAHKLFAESGIQMTTLPFEFVTAVDKLANQQVKDKRNNLIRRGMGKLRDLGNELVFRERELHRERVSVIRQLRQALEYPNDPNNRVWIQSHQGLYNQYTQMLAQDYQAAEAVAQRVSSQFADEMVHHVVGEKRAQHAVVLNGPVGDFFRNEIIRPLLTTGLATRTVNAEQLMEIRAKIQNFFFDPRFVSWYDGQPQDIKDSLKLSLSYGTDIVPYINEVLLPQLLQAQDHGRSVANLDQYVANLVLKVNVGTLESGQKGIVREDKIERLAARSITNQRVFKLYQEIRASGNAPQVVPDTYLNAPTGRAKWLGKTASVGIGHVGAGLLAGGGIYTAQRLMRMGGNLAVPVAGGAAVGAVVRGFEEARQFTREYEEHNIEGELGYSFARDARRRNEMLRIEISKRQMEGELTVPMRQLLQTLERNQPITETEVMQLMGLVADTIARLHINDFYGDEKGFGVLAAQNPQSYQVEKTNLELTKAQAKVALRRYLTGNAATQTNIANQLGITTPAGQDATEYIVTELARVQVDAIKNGAGLPPAFQVAMGNLAVSKAESIVAREKAFKRARFKRAVGASAITLAGGLVGVGAGKVASWGVNRALELAAAHNAIPIPTVENWLINHGLLVKNAVPGKDVLLPPGPKPELHSGLNFQLPTGFTATETANGIDITDTKTGVVHKFLYNRVNGQVKNISPIDTKETLFVKIGPDKGPAVPAGALGKLAADVDAFVRGNGMEANHMMFTKPPGDVDFHVIWPEHVKLSGDHAGHELEGHVGFGFDAVKKQWKMDVKGLLNFGGTIDEKAIDPHIPGLDWRKDNGLIELIGKTPDKQINPQDLFVILKMHDGQRIYAPLDASGNFILPPVFQDGTPIGGPNPHLFQWWGVGVLQKPDNGAVIEASEWFKTRDMTQLDGVKEHFLASVKLEGEPVPQLESLPRDVTFGMKTTDIHAVANIDLPLPPLVWPRRPLEAPEGIKGGVADSLPIAPVRTTRIGPTISSPGISYPGISRPTISQPRPGTISQPQAAGTRNSSGTTVASVVSGTGGSAPTGTPRAPAISSPGTTTGVTAAAPYSYSPVPTGEAFSTIGSPYPNEALESAINQYSGMSRSYLRPLEDQEKWKKDRSVTLEANPQAKLDQQTELGLYFQKMSTSRRQRIEGLVSQSAVPMKDTVRSVITIPAAAALETENIIKTLDLLTKQQNADPQNYEVVLYLNWRENADMTKVQQTIDNVNEFIRNNPAFPLRVFTEQLESATFTIGDVMKTVNDIALKRVQDAGIKEDVLTTVLPADVKGISNTFIEKLMENVNKDKDIYTCKIDFGTMFYDRFPGFHVPMRVLQAILRLSESSYPAPLFTSGAGLQIKSSMLAAIGNYDETLKVGEDADIGMKCVAARLGNQQQYTEKDFPIGRSSLDMWVEVDPARLLDRYRNGESILSAWNDFAEGGYKARPINPSRNDENLETEWPEIQERIEAQLSSLNASYDNQLIDRAFNLMLFGKASWERTNDGRIILTEEGKKRLFDALFEYRDRNYKNIKYQSDDGNVKGVKVNE